ncbi:MAG: hypothetical protein JWM29_394 [Solirubrobacterales bacterium]|nr:hypothetical protein [Solirubrobacterales bacterium]
MSEVADEQRVSEAVQERRLSWPLRRTGALPAGLPAWTITAALGLIYLILTPASSDLAAAAYRSDLFARVGFTLWDNSWYGGHHLPAYSLLAPGLGAAIGAPLLTAISMTGAAALFALLIDSRFRARATRVASIWFALGAAIGLLSSRVPFDLGLALGLGALVLAQRRHPGWALALALLTSVASPVAGAFLALAFLAWALAGPARRWPAALIVAALGPIALLVLMFPEGGSQPFAASAFYPALAGVLLIAVLIPGDQRVLRMGAWLYAAALTASYVIPTAVGGNIDRLGALAAGPVAACVLAGAAATDRRRLLLVVLAPALLYWQANAPVADFAAAVSDPAVKASYYTPLLNELRAVGVGYAAAPARIEVVATVAHWEARWVAPEVMLARGWERQLDRLRNGLFYASAPVTPAGYRAWLSEQGVSYVALPDAPLDYSAMSEARLLRGVGAGGPPAYLREVWSSAHWRLFAVLGAQPLVPAPARLTQVGSDSFTLVAPNAGAFTVLLHFSPYWTIAGGRGCVQRAPGDWTEVRARGAGRLHVIIRFSLARVFSHGPRCS